MSSVKPSPLVKDKFAISPSYLCVTPYELVKAESEENDRIGRVEIVVLHF